MTYPNYDYHRVFADIRDERARQDAKWDEQHWPDGTHPSFAHDAEMYQAVVDSNSGQGLTNWTHILLEEVYEALAETDPAKLRDELVQAAAVIVNWLEDIDGRAATVGEAIIALVPGAEGAGVKP